MLNACEVHLFVVYFPSTYTVDDLPDLSQFIFDISQYNVGVVNDSCSAKIVLDQSLIASLFF